MTKMAGTKGGVSREKVQVRTDEALGFNWAK